VVTNVMRMYVNSSNKCCGLWTIPMNSSVDKGSSAHRMQAAGHTLQPCGLWAGDDYPIVHQ